MLGVRNEQKEEEYAFLCSQLAEVLIAARTIQRTQSVAQNVTPEPHQPDEFKIRLHALQEGIAALQMHIDESEKPHQDDQMLRSPTPMEEEDACEETADEPLSAKAHGEECVVLLLPLLTASLRQVQQSLSRQRDVRQTLRQRQCHLLRGTGCQTTARSYFSCTRSSVGMM